jgi:peptidoglycan/LPS O-acetylase OafA/YrhL
MASPFAIRANMHALLDNSRQNNVDLLRALAITAVFIHHAQHVFGGNVPFFGAAGGWFGVQLFFVISGYLIVASYEKHRFAAYVVHRMLRIAPAYLFFFLAIGFASKAITGGAIATDPWAFVVNLIFLQHLFPTALVRFDVLHVSWTLTIEVLWYVVAPLLLVGNGLVRWPTVAVTLLVSTAWSYAASTGALDFMYPGVSDVNPAYAYLFVVNHFFAQTIFFVFGAWIYFHRHAIAHINPVTALCLAILIFVAQPYYLIFNPVFITGIGIALLLVTALNSEPIRSRFVFLISETSYSIYLCHFPVMLWVRDRLDLKGPTGLALSIAVIMLLALASYVLIEKPFVKLGRLSTRSGRRTTDFSSNHSTC